MGQKKKSVGFAYYSLYHLSVGPDYMMNPTATYIAQKNMSNFGLSRMFLLMEKNRRIYLNCMLNIVTGKKKSTS